MIDFKTIIPENLKDFLNVQKNRMYLILGFSLLFAAVYFTFIIFPKFSELAGISTENNKLNFQINLVNNRVKRLDEMVGQLDTLKEEFKGYSKGLPEEKEIPELLENLSLIAKKSGVKILGITPSDLKKAAKLGESSKYYRELPIGIIAKSGYHELGHFVNSLEKGERFITIKDLQIRYDGKSPRIHNVKIILMAYVWVEDEKK